MKKIIVSSLCIIILCSYIFYRYHDKKPFRCDAQLISHIEQNNSKLELNIHANVIFMLNKEGALSLAGSVKHDGKEYLVSRTVFFTTHSSGLSNINKTTITHENVNKSDEVPQEVWLKYILPAALGAEFYSEMYKMNKNGMLVQMLSNPLFVCVRVEN